MTAIDVKWDQASARRLARAGLVAPLSGQAAGTVAAMAGAHAQVMSAAEVSVAMRTAGAVAADVRDALWESRTLVKAHGPRGTIHLLPAADLPAWLGALSALPGNPNQQAASVRLSAEQEAQVIAAIVDAVSDRSALTIDELDEAVQQRCPAWAADKVMPGFNTFWPRWRQALHVAAHQGAVVFGPNRGRKTTYTSPVWRPWRITTASPSSCAPI